MSKIPIIMFSGFLGSGKTTLLGRLLPDFAAGRRIAVLVNDFGKLSLDGALLRRCAVPVLEIAGGSIFCVCKQADLVKQLTGVARDLRPDMLLIEASGLAEPTDAAALLQNTFLRESFFLPRVITVVDAVNYPKLANVLPVLDKQIAVADVVIVSKCDLAETIPDEAVRKINPGAEILHSSRGGLSGRIDVNAFVECKSDVPLRLCNAATPGFSTVNWSGSLPEAELDALMTEFKDRLLRAKGVMNGRHLELVNGVFHWSDDAPKKDNGIFFALAGESAKEFLYRLKLRERKFNASGLL